MGTPKQAETIVRLHRQLDLLRHDRMETHAQEIYDEAISLDHGQIRKVFEHLNAKTGYSRKRTLSSDKQRLTIVGLEKEIYGQSNSQPWTLTIEEADNRIKALIQQRNAARAELQSLTIDLRPAVVTDENFDLK